jgi:hypothetical protein
VNRSIGYTEHFQLSGGGGVRVVSRLVSGRDGLHWTVRFDPGTGSERPEVLAETAALVNRCAALLAGRDPAQPPN